jgi:hypothetical protein
MSDKTNSAIVGASPSSVLTNLDAIGGGGTVGLGGLSLVNGAAARILSDLAGKTLVINTGANTITNAGLLEGAGGGMRVASAVENDGVLRAVTVLTCSRGVTGSGRAVIAGGALRFLGAFGQDVSFSGVGGVLGLTYSRFYAGIVSGFATDGADALDLADIQFTGGTEATFSGTVSGGVLTVADGTHTAHIHLHGDYVGVDFVTAADGQGGTMVTDGARSRASLERFIAAMAGHPAGSAAPINAPSVGQPRIMTANPH